MTRRFYVAASLAQAALARQVADALKARGWVHTHDWTTHEHIDKPGTAVPGSLRRASMDDIRGVETADVVICLMPGGRGTYCELGAAIALSKRIFVVAQTEAALMEGYTYWTAFFDHPRVRLVVHPDILNFLSLLPE